VDDGRRPVAGSPMLRGMSFDERRPFTRADAIAAGIEPRLLRGSQFRRIFRGVYVAAGSSDTPMLRAAAALLPYAGTDAFASHATAARVHGVPLPALPDEHVTVLRAGERRRHADVRVHVSRNAEVLQVGGVRVSSYAQMFVEMAGQLSLVDLVVVGDNLVRRGLISTGRLRDFCSGSRHSSARAAARAARYVRERVDSPMETRLRMLIVLAGLPEPEINLSIRARDGEVVRRYDLSWPTVRVIVEYDGRQHIEREEQWEADLDRREAIDDDGWRILVVTSRGIYHDPGKTVLRVWKLLRRRGLAGLPAAPADGWRLHFPGRN